MNIIAGYGSDDDIPRQHPAGLTDQTTQQTVEINTSTGTDTVGRVRTFPHIQGNFPTHVYIKVTVPDLYKPLLEAALQSASQLVPGCNPTTDGLSTANNKNTLAQSSYHISLSRTVPIRLEQSDTLLAEIREELRRTLPISATTNWKIRIQQPEIFVNDGNTRTFLALSTSNNSTDTSLLIQAIAAVSRAFQSNGLPKFYDDPRPHISIAWWLSVGDDSTVYNECIDKIIHNSGSNTAMQKLFDTLSSLESCWEMMPTEIVCRVGQKDFIVWKSTDVL